MKELNKKLQSTRKGGVRYLLRDGVFTRNNSTEGGFFYSWVIKSSDVGEDFEFIYEFSFQIKHGDRVINHKIENISADDLLQNTNRYEKYFKHIAKSDRDFFQEKPLGTEGGEKIKEVKEVNQRYIDMMDEYRCDIRSLTFRCDRQQELINKLAKEAI